MEHDDASGTEAAVPLDRGASSAGSPTEPPEWLLLEWELNDQVGSPGVGAGELGPVLSAAFRRASDRDLAASALSAAGLEREGPVGSGGPHADARVGGADAWAGHADAWAGGLGAVDAGLFLAPEELEAFPAPVVRAELREVAGAGLVRRLVRLEQLEAARVAERAAIVGALVDLCVGDGTDPFRTAEAASIAASEVSAALKVSARTAKGLVNEALSLTEPAAAPVLAALASGRLSRRRAQTVLDAAVPVPPERLGAFLAAAVEAACPADPDRVPSPGALARRLRRLVEDHAEEPLAVRKAHAAAGRRVDLDPAPDGMCWLTAYLPLERGAAIDTRLEAIARSLQGPDERRTLPQLRADALADLITTGHALTDGRFADAAGRPEPAGSARAAGPAGAVASGAAGLPVSGAGGLGVRCEVLLVLPAATAAGTADTPAELLGYGPLDPAAARLLAAQSATWTRIWADPDTGAPLAIGRTRYTPTAAMRRYLGARDATCRFPGCDRPAPTTEADHTTEWHTGGHTAVANLALLCREHHRLKTRGHWTLNQPDPAAHQPDPAAHQPDRAAPARPAQSRGGPTTASANAPDTAHATPPAPPGTLHWTSPAGLTYTTYPHHDPPPPF